MPDTYETALHLAINQQNSVEMVEALIRLDVININVIAKDIGNALMIAT
jgi:hypothetical protein